MPGGRQISIRSFQQRCRSALHSLGCAAGVASYAPFRSAAVARVQFSLLMDDQPGIGEHFTSASIWAARILTCGRLCNDRHLARSHMQASPCSRAEIHSRLEISATIASSLLSPSLACATLTMENSNSQRRKRKADDEAHETNEILQQALGISGSSSHERRHRESRRPQPAANQPTRNRARRDAAEMLRLRSVVDARVIEWQRRKGSDQRLSAKQGNSHHSNGTWNSTTWSSNQHHPLGQVSTDTQNTAAFRRFTNEDPGNSSKRKGQHTKVKLERRDHRHGGSKNSIRKRRSISAEPDVVKKPKSEDSPVAIKIKREQSTDGEDSESHTNNDETRVSNDAVSSTTMQAADAEDRSSDEDGIIEVVDTRKKREPANPSIQQWTPSSAESSKNDSKFRGA